MAAFAGILADALAGTFVGTFAVVTAWALEAGPRPGRVSFEAPRWDLLAFWLALPVRLSERAAGFDVCERAA